MKHTETVFSLGERVRLVRFAPNLNGMAGDICAVYPSHGESKRYAVQWLGGVPLGPVPGRNLERE